MSVAKPKKAKPKPKKPSGEMKRFLDANKYETRIIGPIERHLMATYSNDRAQDVIHPSEMAKAAWCPRATYYRLSGVRLPQVAPRFRLDTIFAAGHEIHAKWQNWAWDIGNLAGRWACMSCGKWWLDRSPQKCPRCKKDKRSIKYLEVPLDDPEYLVSGCSDGWWVDDKGDALIEIKSIGLGTLRFEAPRLLREHENNIDAIWNAIRRPLPSHLRQGNIYLRLARRYAPEINKIIYIYEFKPNQAIKEFEVTYQPDMVEPLFDTCLDIKYALSVKMPPHCRSLEGKCDDCTPYEEAANGKTDRAEDAEPSRGADEPQPEGEGRSREGGPVSSEQAEVRAARPRVRRRPDGVGRQRPDVAVHDPNSLGGLLRRATSPSGD